MKKLLVCFGKNPDHYIIKTQDGAEVCRIYSDGANGSKLTDKQAQGYAELFAIAPELLENLAALQKEGNNLLARFEYLTKQP